MLAARGIGCSTTSRREVEGTCLPLLFAGECRHNRPRYLAIFVFCRAQRVLAVFVSDGALHLNPLEPWST